MENDEIGQVVRLEIEGMKMAIKAPVQIAAFFGRLIRALIRYNSAEQKLERIDYRDRLAATKRKSELKNITGECSIRDIHLMSDGAMYMIVNPHDEYFDAFIEKAKEAGLHFARTYDFDSTDKRTPLAIPPEEKMLYDKLLKDFEDSIDFKYRTELHRYDNLISDCKEKLHAIDMKQSTENREPILADLESFQEAQKEVRDYFERKEDLSHVMAFDDYIRGAKNTEFVSNPEKAVEKAVEGAQVGKRFRLKDVLQPIRSEIKTPASKIYFYLPENGSVIKREFIQDHETGLMYSNYSVKNNNEWEQSKTDFGQTTQKWNDGLLPYLMKDAGALENAECYIFTDEESLNKHVKANEKYNNRHSESEENAKKKYDIDGTPFSSNDIAQEVFRGKDEQKKARASEPITNDNLEMEVRCDDKALTNMFGRVRVKISDNEYLEFSNIIGLHKDGNQWVFNVNKDCNPSILNRSINALGGWIDKNHSINMFELNQKLSETHGKNPAESLNFVFNKNVSKR